jgi:uncharacterized membrane protein YtjA (UPF0391 family)
MRQASCGLCQYYFFIHYLIFIYYLVHAAAACFRHPAHDGGQDDFLFDFLLFSACSGSMREASCGKHDIAHYLLFIFIYLFIYLLVSATAARVKHPAGHANIIIIY